jgi:hypothetical protein
MADDGSTSVSDLVFDQITRLLVEHIVKDIGGDVGYAKNDRVFIHVWGPVVWRVMTDVREQVRNQFNDL